jgi:ribonucleoside-diphosphate reductase alpha chain
VTLFNCFVIGRIEDSIDGIFDALKIEQVFDFEFTRRLLDSEGERQEFRLVDYAATKWKELRGDEPWPEAVVDARRLSPEKHLDMEAALQPYVDNAISKTINVPRHYDFNAFQAVYDWAFDQGLKGCTTFRENEVTGSVLASEDGSTSSVHCCSAERECDCPPGRVARVARPHAPVPKGP